MDPLTLDILWRRLISAADEQAAALMRSSFTSIVRDAGDLSAAVFDRRGRMLAQAVTGTPGHINSMAAGMAHFLRAFPLETLSDGDVLITNDPWLTAGQLNDITIATPVFHRGRCVGFFANCCHALDIGGRGLAADSENVFEEGLSLPMLKLIDAGSENRAIFDIIAANSRTPEEVLGDLHSQIVANEVGAERLVACLAEFGLDDLEAAADAIISRSEAAMRADIAALPDGDHAYDLTIDGFDAPILLCAAIRIRGDTLSVDFTGSSGASPRGINVCLNYTHAYTIYGIKCAVSPEVPMNHGAFQPIDILAPQGSILNAKRPAAVAGRHLVGHFLPSVVMGALAEALPSRVAAPGFDALWNTMVAGTRRDGTPFSYTWFASGGAGAMQGKDGLSATAYPSGVAGVPTEVIETLSPLILRENALRQGSGGAGAARGGLGRVIEFEVATDESFTFSGLYDRIEHAAPGLLGGGPGAPGRLTARSPDGAPMPIHPKRMMRFAAQTIIRLELPGGGGFGPAEQTSAADD